MHDKKNSILTADYVTKSIVVVYSNSESETGFTPVGSGVLVSDRVIVTCAHVVSSAIGLGKQIINEPQNRPLIKVSFPFASMLSSPYLEANIMEWGYGTSEMGDDLALLELTNTIPEDINSCSFSPTVEESQVKIYGIPRDLNRGVWCEANIVDKVEGGRIQFTALDGQEARAGFSGGPVFTDNGNKLIGITVEIDANIERRTGFFISSEKIIATFPNFQLDEKVILPWTPSQKKYIRREADERIEKLLKSDQGLTLFIKGAEYMGKSLLLKHIKTYIENQIPSKVVSFVNFIRFDKTTFNDEDSFYFFFFRELSKDLGVYETLASEFQAKWKEPIPVNAKGSECMELILNSIDRSLVLILDQVDELIHSPMRSDFFRMLRGWHNDRAGNELFKKLDIILSASTEPEALAPSDESSPFNVAELITLENFSFEQLKQLALTFEKQLTVEDLEKIITLFNGHPYLSYRAIEFCQSNSSNELEAEANKVFEGVFASYNRSLLSKVKLSGLTNTIKNIPNNGKITDMSVVHKLYSLGLIQQEDNAFVFKNNHYRHLAQSDFLA